MEYDRLWSIAEQARGRQRLTDEDAVFVHETLPQELAGYPHLDLPQRVRHPAGFSIAGAPVGTFLKSALLLSGQRVLGRRFGGHPFYVRVEKDLAFSIMRANFHHGYPKGTFCCAQCTLAVYPVLEAHAIRYFDSRELAMSVRQLIETRQWRFENFSNTRMIHWSLGTSDGRLEQ